MKKTINKIYSKLSYYLPFIVKLIDNIYYNINNITSDKKLYQSKIINGKTTLDKILKNENYYYVLIDQGIGDAIICANYAYTLEIKYNKKIAFIVPKYQVGILKQYDYIKNIIGLSKEELQNIVLYINKEKKYETSNYKYAYFKMKIAKNGKRNYSSAIWNKKLYLSERYKKCVFNLTNEKMYDVKLKNSDNINILKKYNLKKNNKKILLIPYANTVGMISTDVWINIGRILKEKGYAVYTNIGNPKNEKAIENTIGINASLEDILYIVNEFDYVIALRCGLAEYLGLASPKMIVINDYEKNYDRWDDINIYSKNKTITNLYVNNKKNNEIIDEIISRIGE